MNARLSRYELRAQTIRGRRQGPRTLVFPGHLGPHRVPTKDDAQVYGDVYQGSRRVRAFRFQVRRDDTLRSRVGRVEQPVAIVVVNRGLQRRKFETFFAERRSQNGGGAVATALTSPEGERLTTISPSAPLGTPRTTIWAIAPLSTLASASPSAASFSR